MLKGTTDGLQGRQSVVHLELEGSVVQVLLDLAPAEQRDLNALTRAFRGTEERHWSEALERRFGQHTFSDQNREQLAGRRCFME